MYQFRVVTFGQENWKDYVFLEEAQLGKFDLNSMNVSRISSPIVVQDERAADAWQAAYKALQDALSGWKMMIGVLAVLRNALHAQS